MKCLKMQKFVESVINEKKQRFNDKAMKLIQLSVYFQDFDTFSQVSEGECKELCAIFGINDVGAVIADLCSFKYVARSTPEDSVTDVASFILQIGIGYEALTLLAERVMCIPVSTASVERSVSAINRIMTKLRIRMGQDILFKSADRRSHGT